MTEQLSAQGPVRLGVIGLGRAFMLMLPTFDACRESVQLVAACAPRAESRDAFAARFESAFTTDSVQALCARPDVDAVYIATPHQMHRDHILCAAAAGKHVLVDKPMAVSMDDANAIVDAVQRSGIQLVVGPAHSFDQPIQQAAQLLQSGELGAPRLIQALNYTDFLYRPRRAEELRTEQGGGVVFSQGAHQIDVVRLLAGRPAASVYAHTANWDPSRPTEGAYTAMIHFGSELCASLTYSGYAHFDSDEWMDWIGELGHQKSGDQYGNARRALASVQSAKEEAALKTMRTFGRAAESADTEHHAHEHFGPIIVSAERGDIRVTAKGIWVYGDKDKRFEAAPVALTPRSGVIDALVNAVRWQRPPPQTAPWGRATLEICHAILESARLNQVVGLKHQTT